MTGPQRDRIPVPRPHGNRIRWEIPARGAAFRFLQCIEIQVLSNVSNYKLHQIAPKLSKSICSKVVLLKEETKKVDQSQILKEQIAPSSPREDRCARARVWEPSTARSPTMTPGRMVVWSRTCSLFTTLGAVFP